MFGASILRFKLTRAARKSGPTPTREFPHQNLCFKDEPGVSDLLLRQLVVGNRLPGRTSNEEEDYSGLSAVSPAGPTAE